MQIPLNDRSLFGNDAGEDEDESVLMSYFVDKDEFSNFLDPMVEINVAKGRKGMGKSALLVKFAHDLRASEVKPGPLVVHRVASDLVALKEPPDSANPHVLQNYWQQVICGAINMQLARDIGFAWRDDQIAVVETAELAGFKGRNLFGALISRLVTKFNLGAIEITPTPSKVVNHEQLLGRLAEEELEQRPIYFLLDDIDAQYQNTPVQQMYVATFFAACRNLALGVNSISQLRIRATVRSDVWASNRRSEDFDKLKQYLTEITWSASEERKILTQRVLAYVKRNWPLSEIAQSWNIERDADALLNLVFVERMRWGESKVRAETVFRILGGRRPRWVAQLCRMAGERAKKEGLSRIALNHIVDSMRSFGQNRLEDLYKEYQYQFSDLRALIEAFSNGPRSYSTQTLLNRLQERYIGHTAVKGIPRVDGVDYFEPLQIARFLFKSGFINGHNKDYKVRGVLEFVSFEERPDLLSVSTNLDDGMMWEIHPAYRNVLSIQG